MHDEASVVLEGWLQVQGSKLCKCRTEKWCKFYSNRYLTLLNDSKTNEIFESFVLGKAIRNAPEGTHFFVQSIDGSRVELRPKNVSEASTWFNAIRDCHGNSSHNSQTRVKSNTQSNVSASEPLASTIPVAKGEVAQHTVTQELENAVGNPKNAIIPHCNNTQDMYDPEMDSGFESEPRDSLLVKGEPLTTGEGAIVRQNRSCNSQSKSSIHVKVAAPNSAVECIPSKIENETLVHPEAGPKKIVLTFVSKKRKQLSQRSQEVADDAPTAGVGIVLEPEEPGPEEYCHVSDIKPQGPVDQTGKVLLGDVLISVDGVPCRGVLRNDIRAMVVGRVGTDVELEFERNGRKFSVIVQRQVHIVPVGSTDGTPPAEPPALPEVDQTNSSALFDQNRKTIEKTPEKNKEPDVSRESAEGQSMCEVESVQDQMDSGDLQCPNDAFGGGACILIGPARQSSESDILRWRSIEILKRYFSRFGEIRDIVLPPAKQTAFLEFQDSACASEVLKSKTHAIRGSSVFAYRVPKDNLSKAKLVEQESSGDTEVLAPTAGTKFRGPAQRATCERTESGLEGVSHEDRGRIQVEPKMEPAIPMVSLKEEVCGPILADDAMERDVLHAAGNEPSITRSGQDDDIDIFQEEAPRTKLATTSAVASRHKQELHGASGADRQTLPSSGSATRIGIVTPITKSRPPDQSNPHMNDNNKSRPEKHNSTEQMNFGSKSSTKTQAEHLQSDDRKEIGMSLEPSQVSGPEQPSVEVSKCRVGIDAEQECISQSSANNTHDIQLTDLDEIQRVMANVLSSAEPDDQAALARGRELILMAIPLIRPSDAPVFISLLCEFCSISSSIEVAIFEGICSVLKRVARFLSVKDLSRVFWCFGQTRTHPTESWLSQQALSLVGKDQDVDQNAVANFFHCYSGGCEFPLADELGSLLLSKANQALHLFSGDQLVKGLDVCLVANIDHSVTGLFLSMVCESLPERLKSGMNLKAASQILLILYQIGCHIDFLVAMLSMVVDVASQDELDVSCISRFAFLSSECNRLDLTSLFVEKIDQSNMKSFKDVGARETTLLIASMLSLRHQRFPAAEQLLNAICSERLGEFELRDLPFVLCWITRHSKLLVAFWNRLNEIRSNLSGGDCVLLLWAIYMSSLDAGLEPDELPKMSFGSGDVQMIVELVIQELNRLDDSKALDPRDAARALRVLSQCDFGDASAPFVLRMVESRTLFSNPSLNCSELIRICSAMARISSRMQIGERNQHEMSLYLLGELERREALEEMEWPDTLNALLTMAREDGFRSHVGRKFSNFLLKRVNVQIQRLGVEDAVRLLRYFLLNDEGFIFSEDASPMLCLVRDIPVSGFPGVLAVDMINTLANARSNPLPGLILKLLEVIRNNAQLLNADQIASALRSFANLSDAPPLETIIDLQLVALSSLGDCSLESWRKEWKLPECGRVGTACKIFWSIVALHDLKDSSGQQVRPILIEKVHSAVGVVLDRIAQSSPDDYVDILRGSFTVVSELYAFFMYLHLFASDLRKSFVDKNQKTFVLAGTCHSLFVESSEGFTESRPIARDVKHCCDELGLAFELGTRLRDCGYVPSLVNTTLRLVVEVVDEELVRRHDTLPALNGAMNVKILLLESFGWSVVCLPKEEWDQISQETFGNSMLARKKLLVSHKLIQKHVATTLPKKDGSNVDDSPDTVEGLKKEFLLFEKCFCLDQQGFDVNGQLLARSLRYFSSRVDSLTASENTEVAGRMTTLVQQPGCMDMIVRGMNHLSMDDAIAFTNFALHFNRSEEGPTALDLDRVVEEIGRKCRERELDTPTIYQLCRLFADVAGQSHPDLLEGLAESILSCLSKERIAEIRGTSIVIVLELVGKLKGSSALLSRLLPPLESALSDHYSQEKVIREFNPDDLLSLLLSYKALSFTRKIPRFVRALIGRGVDLFSETEPSKFVEFFLALTHLHISVDSVLDSLSARLLCPAFLDNLTAKDLVNLIWMYATIGSSDSALPHGWLDKLIESGKPADVFQVITELGPGPVIDFLWSLASLGIVSKSFVDEKICKLQVDLCGHLATEWKSGRLTIIMEASDPVFIRRRYLVQYALSVLKHGAEGKLQLPPDFRTLFQELARECAGADHCRELDEVREGLKAALASLNLEVLQALPRPDLGYMLSVELRSSRPTLIEVYGRSDCYESVKDRQSRPGGGWALRIQHLRAAGYNVVVIGFDQWAGLSRTDGVDGRARWLQNLISASEWASGPGGTVATSKAKRSESPIAEEKQSKKVKIDVIAKEVHKSSAPMELDEGTVSPPGEVAKVAGGKGDALSPAAAAPQGTAEKKPPIHGTSKSAKKGHSSSGRPSLRERSLADPSGTGKSAGPEPVELDPSALEDAVRQTKKRIKEGRVWTIHYSASKKLWYYSNNKTGEKCWKPPVVENWKIKQSSGQHRPYLGLRLYYYNAETKKMQYEPPD